MFIKHFFLKNVLEALPLVSHFEKRHVVLIAVSMLSTTRTKYLGVQQFVYISTPQKIIQEK